MAYPVPHTWYVNGVFLETGAPFNPHLIARYRPAAYQKHVVMLAKAFDIVRDVQKVGQELLVAIENNDAEALVQMKASHEQAVVTLSRTVQDLQVTELEKELETVETEKENLEQEEAEQNSFYTISDLENKYEELMGKVRQVQEVVEKIKKAASVSYKLPDFDAGGILNGLGGPSFDVSSLGGSKIGENLVSSAEAYVSKFLQRQIDAAKVKIQAEAERKLQEWTMKKTVKQNEAKTVEKKAVTAQIKIQQAQKENEHIEQEIERKAEMYDMLSEKFSSKELYTWMVTELGNIYKTMFRLAVKVARKAEKCYHFEIGDTELGKETQFIKGTGSYWNGLSSGLLAGEALLSDLHAMEVAYLDNDRLEQEITVPVSLKEIDCCAFRELQATCSVEFMIPMAFFDMDFPSHYFRRIRGVRMEIECNRGENQVVSAELALIANTLNVNNGGNYIENRIGVNAVASSQAQYKNGRFSFDFNTDKYRPFEGAGCDQSTWRITLPQVLKRFNYMDITDIKLYISYTARSGKSDANPIDDWNANTTKWGEAGMVHEIQLSRDLPELYDSIKNSSETEHTLTVEQIKACLPYEADGDIKLKGWLIGDASLGFITAESGDQPAYLYPSSSFLSSDNEINVTSQLSIDTINLVNKQHEFEIYLHIKYTVEGN